jgi:hypothetical protein
LKFPRKDRKKEIQLPLKINQTWKAFQSVSFRGNKKEKEENMWK